MIKKIFTNNNTFEDFREQARYEFTWRLLLLFFVGIFSLSLFVIITNSLFIFHFLGALFIIILAILVIWKWEKYYKSVASVLFILLSTIIYISVLTVEEDMHFMFPFLLLMISLASYFMLGTKWGIFYLFLNCLLFFLYYQYFFLDLEHFIAIVDNNFSISTSIEFLLVMLMLGFVMHNYALLSKNIIYRQANAIRELDNKKKSIKKQNEEKTILIQEIHHRVKNNLQVIISLLRMHSNALEPNVAKDDFDKVIGRIMTLSLVHQKMYENKTLNEINLKGYIERLISDLTRSVQINIDYQSNIEEEFINLDKAISIGLVINEIISNTSFSNFENYSIHVKRVEDKEIEMEFIEKKATNPKEQKPSLSLNLIQIFSQQIGGKLEVKEEKEKTLYSFRFLN